MKAVLLILSLIFVFQIAAGSTYYRKTKLENSLKDFIDQRIKSLDPSKLIQTLGFLANLAPSSNKLDAFTPIFKEYLHLEKEAKESNLSLFSYIMKKFFPVESENLGYNNWTCTQCEDVVKSLQGYDNSTLVTYLESLIELVCSAFEGENVCGGIFHEYAHEFVKNFFKRIFNPIETCGALGFCKDSYHVRDFNEYLKTVLADKPLTPSPQPTLKNTFKVLHLADMHIDFEYEEGKNAFCDVPFCCRGENGDPATPDQGAQYWGTMAVCDIPPRTAEQALRFISEYIKPDLILWTGDNISHDVWHQNVTNQTRPTIFLTGLIEKYLNGTPFYPIFGNHECFPADQYDVFGNETEWLRNQTGNLWRNYLDDQAFTSLRLYGYYSSYNSKFNLRIIVLNTQTCDTLNFFLLRNPTDPAKMLEWLRNELYIAENGNQGVYIIGHIPPGNQFCLSEWAERYTALIDRFSHIVRGQFFGHTHLDHFEIIHSFVDDSLVGTVFIAPSLTTFSNQNPSFRVFEVDQDTGLPVQYFQYRLNLSKVNENKTNATLMFDLAYDMLTEYSLPNLSWESMDSLSKSILENHDTRKKYISNYYAGGTPGQLTDDQVDETYNVRSYHCKTQNPVFKNFVDCLGWTFIQDPLDWIFLVLQSLDGDYHTFNTTVVSQNQQEDGQTFE